MAKFLIPPNSSSYGHQQNAESLYAELDGGAPKVRRDIIGAAFNLNVTWLLDQEQYTYARAFYRTATNHGSEPFLIDLILESAALEEYEALFVPGSWQLTEQSGHAYTVSAQLWVTPPVNPDEATDDQAIITAYETAHG
jgi:hypothetical protein